MSDGKAPSSPFIPQLTFIRFPAVVWIAIFHYGAAGFPFATTAVVEAMISQGYLMVTFFFVLSGFTLAVRYFGQEIQFKRFMLARLARIYPLYALGLLFFVGVHAHTGTVRNQLTAIFFNVLMLQSWVPPVAVSLNSPCWFLSVLVSFYLVFPLFLDQFRRLTPKQLVATLTLIWLSSFVVLIVFKRTAYAGYPSASHNLLFYHPLMHLNSFLVGVGGGAVFRTHVQPRDEVRRWSLGLAIGALIGVLAAAIWDQSGYLLHNGLLAPLFLIFIVGLALDTSWLAQVSSTKWALALGNTAFAIYILQAPWKVTFLNALSWLGLHPMSEYWLLYLMTLLIVSAMAVAFIENPLNGLLVSRMLRPKQIGAAE